MKTTYEDRRPSADARLLESLDKMATMLSGDTADTGVHFTCKEAEVIAEVLYRTGHTKAAAIWLGVHAEDDDFGDSHAFMRTDDDSFDSEKALAHVEGLFLDRG